MRSVKLRSAVILVAIVLYPYVQIWAHDIPGQADQVENTRLVVLADMGNEPDEVQQMVYMLMYSNEFDVEGLIAVSSKYLHAAHHLPERTRLYPDLFHMIIDAYEQDLENLRTHASDWPDPDYLRSLVVSGQPDYGIQGVKAGHSTPGSELIIDIVTKADARPVYNPIASLYDYKRIVLTVE